MCNCDGFSFNQEPEALDERKENYYRELEREDMTKTKESIINFLRQEAEDTSGLGTTEYLQSNILTNMVLMVEVLIDIRDKMPDLQPTETKGENASAPRAGDKTYPECENT